MPVTSGTGTVGGPCETLTVTTSPAVMGVSGLRRLADDRVGRLRAVGHHDGLDGVTALLRLGLGLTQLLADEAGQRRALADDELDRLVPRPLRVRDRVRRDHDARLDAVGRACSSAARRSARPRAAFCSACASCWPVTFGTLTSTGPSEVIRVTRSPWVTRAPDPGSVEITSPLGTVSLCRRVAEHRHQPGRLELAGGRADRHPGDVRHVKYWPASSHQPATPTTSTARTMMIRLLNSQRCRNGSP